MFCKHPSILKIKDYINIKDTFSFKNITSHECDNKCLRPNKKLLREATLRHDNSCVSKQNLQCFKR